MPMTWTQKNGTPLKDAVLGDVVDVPNLLQKSAFTLLTVHLVFLCCARWCFARLNPGQTYLTTFRPT